MKIKTLLVLMIVFCFASLAHAQATRTWVSGVGNDANPCSRTAPCKTFAGAISKTAEHGEISVLDPGGYGAVTINKGMTINGEGTLAGILNTSVSGVVVNVTTNPSIATVMLHNISINGAGTPPGLNGINYLAGNTLVVDNCWIYGQGQQPATAGVGINVSLATNGNLKVNNTLIEDIQGPCIKMSTTSGQVLAMIDNSHLRNCTNGVEAVNRVRADVANSVITHTTNGVVTTGTDSTLNLDDLFISFCTTALKTNNAGTPSHIRVSDSIIAQNGTGLDTSLGGTIDSFQGNSLMGNTTPGAFSTTTNKQ